MKEIRAAALALILIVLFVIAGCAIQTPGGTIQLAVPPAKQEAPASIATTAPLTTTTASAPEDAIKATFNLPANANGYIALTPAQLHQILPDHKFTLVDVHIPYQGEIPQTNLFIPFDKIAGHQAELPAKDAPIVLYCKTGPMSVQAAKTLVGLGYSHIYTLKGGFDAWGAAKYALLNKK